MKILYGIIDNNIDVTEICLNKLKTNNIITIPSGDRNRAIFFSDPLPGILKKIFVLNESKLTEYSDNYIININTVDNTIFTTANEDINSKINNIHSKLKIIHGSFNEELPEQKMSVRYLKGDEKILEIGGNIGRNSMVISHILGKNDKNLVVLESDPDIAIQLEHNKQSNNLNFHIEPSALSKKPLIQGGWTTKISNVLEPGYKWVKTITLQELNEKYNINFDTLVLDCEGAFYYILMDIPEILNNIKLIIMENDYFDYFKKEYVDKILKENGFYRNYVEGGGWGPCSDNFYEVWKR